MNIKNTFHCERYRQSRNTLIHNLRIDCYFYTVRREKRRNAFIQAKLKIKLISCLDNRGAFIEENEPRFK